MQMSIDSIRSYLRLNIGNICLKQVNLIQTCSRKSDYYRAWTEVAILISKIMANGHIAPSITNDALSVNERSKP